MRRLNALLCAVLVSMAPGLAGAEPTIADRNAARALADKGADLYEAGKYAEAIEQFKQADAFVHAPPHLLYIARAHTALGNLVEAHRVYEDILVDLVTPQSPAAFRDAQETARNENARLLERIPKVRLNITSPDIRRVQVTIDGKAVQPEHLAEPIPVNPGAHTIEASGKGLVPDSAPVKVSEGDRINLTLSLRWQGSLIPAIATLGAGGAVFTVGVVTGIISLVKVGNLADRCPDKICLAAEQPNADSAATFGTVSTVGLIAGTALLGAGAALFVLRPGGGPPDEAPAEEQLFPQTATVRARVGLGTLMLEGTF